MPRQLLTGPDGEQDLAPQRVFDLSEVELGFALVAQDLEDGRPALLSDIHTIAIKLHDVHLQRFHLKIARVSAVRAGQCHASSSSLQQDQPGIARKKRAIGPVSGRAL
jgi:hypothetical protein